MKTFSFTSNKEVIYRFRNGVKLEDTFLSILERRINRDSLIVDIIKAGVMAYGTRDELDVLKTIGKKYLPNIIISFFYSNDIGENYKKFMVKEGDLIQYPSKFDRLKVFLAHRSRLYNLITLVKTNHYVFNIWSNVLDFYRSLGNGKTYQPRRLSLDDMIKHTADLLLETKERACLLGSQYFVVIIPDKGEVYGENNDGYYRNRQIAVECQERGINVLDLLPYFREEVRNNPNELLYFERDPHFTPSEHRLVGKVFYRYLKKNSNQLGADLIFPENR